jgi:RimJ/RimL family protein N-acetyltransferase
MAPPLRLATARLVLRPLSGADAAAVQRLAGDPEVARSTADLPYPFDLAVAEAWLATQEALREEGRLYAFGLEGTAAPGVLIGAIGLTVDREHGRAELGYWLGRAAWGKGLATEAGGAVLAFAFGELGLERVFASHLGGNERSGRVLRKLGFRHEGTFRRHVRRFGVREDLAWYGLLRDEWAGAAAGAVVPAPRP